MAHTTMAVIKLAKTSGNFALRTSGAGVYFGAGVNATTGNDFVISSTGQGIEDFSKLILVFNPCPDFSGGGAGASAHATTDSMNVTIQAATQGASVFPTLAGQGSKTMTIFNVAAGTPTSGAGTTHAMQVLGPFESARFLSTRGGRLGLAMHLAASAGNCVYSLSAIALPGAYSTYG